MRVRANTNPNKPELFEHLRMWGLQEHAADQLASQSTFHAWRVMKFNRDAHMPMSIGKQVLFY